MSLRKADVAAGAHLLEDLLEALLEVAAVARAGHEGAHVQGVELLVAQGLGHVAVDDDASKYLNLVKVYQTKAS